MGWLQQATVPVPPLVTMNSDPHLAQIYLLPVSLANCFLPVLEVENRCGPTRIAVIEPRAIIDNVQGVFNLAAFPTYPKDRCKPSQRSPGFFVSEFKTHQKAGFTQGRAVQKYGSDMTARRLHRYAENLDPAL